MTQQIIETLSIVVVIYLLVSDLGHAQDSVPEGVSFNFKTFKCIPRLLLNVSIILVLISLQKCRPESGISLDQQTTVRWIAQPTHSVSDQHPDVYESKPLCLDEHKFRLTRECNGSHWIPQPTPVCTHVQKPYEEYETCILGYRKAPGHINSDLCIRILAANSWNTPCPVGYSTLFYDLDADSKEYVLDLIRERNISSVWMPAKRIYPNGPVLWNTPGERNGENVIRLISTFNSDKHIYKSDCFVAHVRNQLMVVDLDDCGKLYPILCMYDEREALTQIACPDGFYTTSYTGRQHVCYSGHKTLTTSNTTDLPLVTTSQRDSTIFPTVSTTTHLSKELANISINTSKMQQKRDWLTKDDSYNYFNDECQGEIFTITSPEKTTIARWLAKELKFGKQEHCLFAIFGEGMYIKGREEWLKASSRVHYVNWDYPLVNGQYLTVNMEGRWNWVPHSFNCLLCQRRIDMEIPKMLLHFDEYRHRLFLTVYAEKFLWRLKQKESGTTCFTNADYEIVRTVKTNKIWTDEISTDDVFFSDGPHTISKTIYELRLYGDGPGYYWCQGYSIPQFTLIEAPKIVAYRRIRGTVFAGLVKVKCYGKECTMVFIEDYVKDLARFYRSHLQKFQRSSSRNDRLSIENVRLMKIEEIEPFVDKSKTIGEATVLFHITVDKATTTKPNKQVNLPDHIFKIWQMREILGRIMLESSSAEYRFISLKSTEYCLPETLNPTDGLKWSAAKIGETIAPQELCLGSNNLPILRSCVGDFLYGGEWNNVTRKKCISAVSEITMNLYALDNAYKQINETMSVVKDINSLLTNSSTKNVVPADLFYLGRVMSTVHRLNSNKNVSTLNKVESENIFSIYNSIMGLNENTTRIAAALNSTNILLSAFDNIINGISMNITSAVQVRNNVIANVEDGTVAIKTSRLINYIIDPAVRTISGIALKRKTKKVNLENDFNDYTIELLYANQSTVSLLAQKDLETAAFVPQELLNRLEETRFARIEDAMPEDAPPVRIVITIFYNDVLFQEYKNITYAKSGGMIMSVSIPGYGPDLPGLLPIFIRTNDHSSEKQSSCGYWGFGSQSGWQNDGCEFGGSSGSVVLCACSHLTHFAYLVLGNYVHTMSDDDGVIIQETHHQEALDMITLLGCSLSLVGIFGIAITAIVFKSWRQKPSSKVLLQLIAAVGLQMVLLLFVNTEYSAINLVSEERWLACVGMGALLQYSILVAYSWMLITAYLQFMRYVKVLGQTRVSRFFLKSFLIGWGLPLIPVLLIVGISPSSYVRHIESQNAGICYPSGTALYLGIILPVSIIVLANLIIYLLVIFNILVGPGGKLRATERDLTLAQLRLSVLLFFLLGLSWIFGLLATTNAEIIFSYLFCLTATIQGFVLFIYFIILDPGTRKLWRNFFSKYFCCCCQDKMVDCK